MRFLIHLNSEGPRFAGIAGGLSFHLLAMARHLSRQLGLLFKCGPCLTVLRLGSVVRGVDLEHLCCTGRACRLLIRDMAMVVCALKGLIGARGGRRLCLHQEQHCASSDESREGVTGALVHDVASVLPFDSGPWGGLRGGLGR